MVERPMPGHLPDPWSLLALLVLGLMAGSLSLTVLACLWEKRLVWPYVPAEEPEAPGPSDLGADTNPYAVGRAVAERDVLTPTDYAARAIEAAELLGFEPLGVFRDGK